MSKQPFENVVHYLFQIAARAEFQSLSDLQLLQRYVDHRDNLAFEELVRRNEAMVWNVCWRTLGQRQDTEDALQATFMVLFRQATRIRQHASIEGWLHHVACKIAHNIKRTQVRRQAREERREKMRHESFHSKNDTELRDILDKELDCLPEKFRGPLILFYLEGLTQKQAAQRIGISVDALEWRMRQGRERLQKRLSKYGLDLSSASLMAGVAPGIAVQQVPPGLVEKTLDMIRILMMSHGVLETSEISPQVAILVKSALGIWTIKTRLLVGIALLGLIGVGGGMAKYAGWLSFRSQQPPQGIPGPAKQEMNKPETREKQPPRVDRYGDPLPAGALERLGTVRFRMEKLNSNHRIAVTSGKKLLVPNSNYNDLDYIFNCYDLVTGNPVHQFQDVHGQTVTFTQDMAVSFDGRLLARKTSPAGDFKTWNLSTGEPLDLRIKNLPNEMAISQDGKSVAVMFHTPKKGGFDLYVWDNVARRKTWTKADKGRSPLQLTYSSDGKIVMAACPPEFKKQPQPQELIIRRWEVATGKELASWSVPQAGSFAWSYDGGVLAASPQWHGNSIRIWNTINGKETTQINLKNMAEIGSMALSPDGKLLAGSTLLADGFRKWVNTSLCLWDTATGKLLRSWDNPNWEGRLVFSQDGKWLVSLPNVAENNRSIHVWDVESGKMINQVWNDRGHSDAVISLSFSSGGETLVSGGGGGSLLLWRKEPGTDEYAMNQLRPQDIGGHESRFGTVAPNSKLAAYVDHKQIHLWETAMGREISNFPTPMRMPLGLAISPNNKVLVLDSVFRNRKVLLYQLPTFKCLIQDGLMGMFFAFSPNSQWLAIRQGENGFYLWDIAACKSVAEVPVGQVIDIAFAPDGRTLAVSYRVKGFHELICIWRIYVDEFGLRLEGSRRLITAPFGTEFSLLTFSPDGRTLAARCKTVRQYRQHTSDFAIHLWETATGKERGCLNEGGSFVTSLAYAPDGRRLASGHEDGTILIWDVVGRSKARKLQPTNFSDQTLAALWADLADKDAIRANRAIWILKAGGMRTVSFFKKQLHPIPASKKSKMSAAVLAQLIADLDNEAFAVRQKAKRELEKLGKYAASSLQQVLKKKPPLALRRSVEELLKKVEQDRIFGVLEDLSTEEVRSIRALEVLGQIASTEAKLLLEALSSGDPEVRPTQEAQSALNYWKRLHQQ